MRAGTTASPGSRTTDAVRVEGLSHHYDKHLAVDDISFEVARGEFFALLGSNGAGKTTALEIVQRLRPVTQGQVTVLGQDVTDGAWRIEVRPASLEHVLLSLTESDNTAMRNEDHQ